MILSLGKNGMYGYVDRSGKEVIPLSFTKAGSFTADGIAPVSYNQRYGFIDKKGNFVIETKYENCTSLFADGYIIIRIDQKYGIVDKNGSYIITATLDEIPAFIPHYGSGGDFSPFA